MLAHELAHIRERDFGLSCFAQFTRALHAYHPLAHLLTRQLLNQMEILADAAAARCVGGSAIYAKALCRLALRPTVPAPRPPALAFWPVTLPLSRRMTMLANRNRDIGINPRWPVRLGLGAILALSLAIVAGLRSPILAQQPQETTQSPITSPTAHAAQTPPQISPFDLRYVRPESAGVFVFRPANLFAEPSMGLMRKCGDELLEQMGTAIFGKPMPEVHLCDFEQVVGSVWFSPKTEKEAGTVQVSLDLVRLRPGMNWLTLLGALVPEKERRQHAGKLYIKMPIEASPLLQSQMEEYAALLDDRTAVFGDEDRVKAVLEGKYAALRPVWSDADWQQVEGCNVAAACDLTKLRAAVAKSPDHLQAELLTPYKAFLQQGDALLFGLLPGDRLGLRLVASAGAGKQLAVDRAYFSAFRHALDDLMCELFSQPKEAQQKRPLTRQSGAAGVGTVLKTNQLVIEMQLDSKLGDVIRPNLQGPIDQATGVRQFEAEVWVYQATPSAFDAALSATKGRSGLELRQPVPAPDESGKAFYAGSGFATLKAADLGQLREKLAQAKDVELLSAPRIRTLEGAPACITTGAALPEDNGKFNPEQLQIVVSVTMKPGAKPDQIALAVSNCLDEAKDPTLRKHPATQPEVRRSADVPADESFVLTIPSVAKDGKMQLVVVTPREVRVEAKPVAFEVMLGRVDAAATKELNAVFPTLNDPRARAHGAEFRGGNDCGMARILAGLTRRGLAKAVDGIKVARDYGSAADFYLEAEPGTPLAAKYQQGAHHFDIVPIRPIGDCVQFGVNAELGCKDGKSAVRVSQTFTAHYNDTEVLLLRTADDKGWWLLTITPMRDLLPEKGVPPTAKPGLPPLATPDR